MARNLFMHRLGFVAILAAAPAFVAQTAAAAESELVVIVTPYLTNSTKQNQSQDNPVGGNRLRTDAVPENQAPTSDLSSEIRAFKK